MPRDIIDRTLDTPHGEAAYKVIERLMDAGHEAWWIGGAVRDMLCGKIPHEIDMASSALPADVIKIFPKNDSYGAPLGTIVVSVSGHSFEITTYREDDTASDGRHPESVRFGSKEKDAQRRDATVNALYWNPVSHELYDPCNGESDIKERLVRFIGDPETRIKHDALRILRMIRLRTILDGQYHPETYAALKRNSHLVSGLSGMRVLQELEKLLRTDTPSKGLEDWLETGVLKHVFPELEACKGVAQPREYHHEGDVWDHLKRCTDSYTEDFGIDVRIAGLFHDIGKATTFVLKERIRFDHHAEASAAIIGQTFKRLQMSQDRIKKLQWLIEHHMMMDAFHKLSDERKAHWYFHPWFQELLQLFWIDIKGTIPGDSKLYDFIIADYDTFLNSHPRPEKPLLSGEEIMTIAGLSPGEEVGKAIRLLKDAQVRKDITSKAEAKKFLQKLFPIIQTSQES